jgi:hypothetical protein
MTLRCESGILSLGPESHDVKRGHTRVLGVWNEVNKTKMKTISKPEPEILCGGLLEIFSMFTKDRCFCEHALFRDRGLNSEMYLCLHSCRFEFIFANLVCVPF